MRTIRQRCGIQNSRHAVYLAGGDLKGHDYFFVAIGAVSYLQLLGETQGRTILVDHGNGAQLRSIGEAQGHVADETGSNSATGETGNSGATDGTGSAITGQSPGANR